MSENIELKAHFIAEDDASPVIKALLRNVRKLEKLGAKLTAMPSFAAGINAHAEKALAAQRKIVASQRSAVSTSARAEKATNASFRQRLAFGERMRAQKVRDERRAERLSMLALKQRLTFADRMNKQRLREERAAATEARRQDAAARREERAHRAHLGRLDRQQRASRRSAVRSAGRARDGLSDVAGRAGTAGLAIGAGAAVAGRRILIGEMGTDAAEKNLQSYGGLSSDAARKLREGWATKLSVELGNSVADNLTAYVEALKLGIPDAGAKDFTKIAVQASEAWQLPLADVQDTLGNINTILTAAGEKFSSKRLAGITNEIQNLAAGMSTTPAKLLEFFKQGAGAASMLGMSQESALAFGAASTSLGNKAGESGTLLDFIAGRSIEMPALTKRGGIEGRQAKELVRALGYGSGEAMDRQRRSDPENFVFDLIERFGKIKDPKKRDAAVRFFAGREWFGEFGRLTTGTSTMRQARQLQKESKSVDAIGKHWAIHKTKLAFLAKQARSALGILSGELGMVLSPFAKDAFQFLTGWAEKSAKALRVNVWAAAQGALEGLLGRPGQMKDLLAKWFGAGGIVADPKRFYDFFKGLAEGIANVWNVVSTVLKDIGAILGIDTSKPEGMGKLVGTVLAGGIAAKLVPGDLIGGLANGVGGLAGLAGSLFGGAVGAAGLPVAISAIAGGLLMSVSVTNWSGLVDSLRSIVSGVKNGNFGDVAKGAKGVWDNTWHFNPFAFSQSYGEWLQKKLLGDSASNSELIKPMRALGDTIGEATKVQKAALTRAGLYRDLIVPASFGGSAARFAGSTAYGGPASSSLTGAAALNGAVPGAPLPAFGVGRSGAAMAGAGGKSMLDAIARAEGTAGRGDYEATLGFGKYGKPSKPITSMTLNEAYAFGRQIKARHGSSSAIGRYQIVGDTMMDAAKGLGMDPNATRFDASTQDRMAQWIASKQGLKAWESFKRHPAELATAQAAVAGVPASGSAAGAVDSMSSMLGASENGPGRAIVNRFMRANGTNIDAARTAWCAAFVNSSLASVGIKGTGKLNANSFLNWGTRIDPSKAVRGDVLVKSRGLGADATGGHVGMATGATRIGRDGGQEIEMISGNSGRAGSVATTWEKAGSLAIRRAVSAVPTPQSISSRVPVPDSPSRSGRGAGMGGGTVHAPITVNAAPGQSPQEIAAAVERHISKARNSYAHDFEVS